MTVSATNASSGPFVGTGSTVAFPFTFRVETAAEAYLEVNGAQSPATITLNVDANGKLTGGGTATAASPPIVGATVYVRSTPSFQQNISFVNNGAFLPSTVEEGFDRAAERSIYLLGLYNIASALATAASNAVAGAVASAVAAAQAVINAAVFTVNVITGTIFSASSRAVISGITSTTIGQRVWLSEAGRGGWWELKSGSYAALITSDTYQGLYLPHATLATSAAAWVRDVPGFNYFTSWWGVAAAFGTTTHLPLQSAADLVPPGSDLFLPNEAITVNNKTILRQDNIRLFGSGPHSEIIANSSGFDVIQVARTGCEVAYFTVTGFPTNLNAGNQSCVILSHNASGFVGTGSIYRNKIHDLYLRNTSLPLSVFGCDNGTTFAPVVGADIYNNTLETNVMGIEVFGADDSDVRNNHVSYFEALSVHNSSNTLTPGIRLLANHGLRVHHNSFDGMAAQQIGHDGVRFSTGNSNGTNWGRRSNQDIVVENNRFLNFYGAVEVDECRGDCIIRDNDFIGDPLGTLTQQPAFRVAPTGTLSFGLAEKVGHLIIEGNKITGRSHFIYYLNAIGALTVKGNRWLANSATPSDGQNILCGYSDGGAVPLVEFINNEFIAPENAVFKITTGASSEKIRVFGNTFAEATGDAHVQTPFSSAAGVINNTGPGVYLADQNRMYPKGTWAARIAYGDRA